MNSVLVTGANGQLGQALVKTVPAHINLVALNRGQLDICDRDAVTETITQFQPDWVINAAAYTAVDQAEKEPESAFAINGHGPQYLAEAVAKVGGRLLQPSTDFVFDGKSSTPYQPEDKLNPLNVYGKSKHLGEQQVFKILGDHVLILRAAWVYDGFNRNFVSTMLRLMKERDELAVVADQVGTPTATETLANTIWQAIQQNWQGIYHLTDAGVASWYDFAVAIQTYGLQLNLLKQPVPIQPISTGEFPTLATRPAYSVLDKSQTWQQFATPPRHWQQVLYQMLIQS